LKGLLIRTTCPEIEHTAEVDNTTWFVRVQVELGKLTWLGNVIFRLPAVVILLLGNKLTVAADVLPITVGDTDMVPDCMLPKVATYWIPLVLWAIEFAALSVIVIIILSVGFVLSGFEIWVNSRIPSKSGLTYVWHPSRIVTVFVPTSTVVVIILDVPKRPTPLVEVKSVFVIGKEEGNLI
jgi:hypothetical protein